MPKQNMESPNLSRAIRTAGGGPLKAQNSFLANADEQIEIIENGRTGDFALIPFQQKLEQSNLYPLKPAQIEIFQVNIGKMCNQTCRNCDVDAGFDREEIMTKETMQQYIRVLKNNPQLKIVDLTDGAPEMNPNFRWFVEEIKNLTNRLLLEGGN
jgi:sulfatase maturation enzyme AslB (radical SAM superfamily)